MCFKSVVCMVFVCFLLNGCAHIPYQSDMGSITRSFDGVPISYSVYGDGGVTLVFVHGWSCDSRYWRYQIPYFAQKYKVVTVDLAGHGHSGSTRSDYTMEAFAEDVQAVAQKIDGQQMILIGHSLGGDVVSHTARLMPDRVIGIIGVDTLHNAGLRHTKEEYNEVVKPFEDDFEATLDSFVRGMFTADADPMLVAWIVNDMQAANRHMALSTLRNYIDQFVTGEATTVAEQVPVPVRVVNADLWPTNMEENRRYYRSFDALIMPHTGHFLHMEQPDEFNRNLDLMVNDIISASK